MIMNRSPSSLHYPDVVSQSTSSGKCFFYSSSSLKYVVLFKRLETSCQ